MDSVRDVARRIVRTMLPRGIAPRRIRGGRLRGLRLVTSWHDYPAGLTGRTERLLLEWFAQHVRPGETWIDVGAHYGYTTFALAQLVGRTGRVFAFEPVAATAGCVDRGRLLNELPQVTLLPIGLGAPDGLEMRRCRVTRGMADWTLAPDAAAAVVDVPLARFDWIWPHVNGGSARIHGINIDVQGMELEALDGMRQAVQAWRPLIVVELHAGVNRARTLELLSDLGYSTDAEAIEAARGERQPLFLDNHSYAFHPI